MEGTSQSRHDRQTRDMNRRLAELRELVATMEPGDRTRVLVVELAAPNKPGERPHVRTTLV